MSKIKDQAIDQYNNRITGRIAKPVNWKTPNFIKRFADYFGVDLPQQSRKPTDYYKKIFN